MIRTVSLILFSIIIFFSSSSALFANSAPITAYDLANSDNIDLSYIGKEVNKRLLISSSNIDYFVFNHQVLNFEKRNPDFETFPDKKEVRYRTLSLKILSLAQNNTEKKLTIDAFCSLEIIYLANKLRKIRIVECQGFQGQEIYFKGLRTIDNKPSKTPVEFVDLFFYD